MSQLKNEINDTIASAIDQNLDLSSSSTDIDQLKSATEGTLNSLTELITSCHTTLDQMSSGAGFFAQAAQSLSSLSETFKKLCGAHFQLYLPAVYSSLRDLPLSNRESVNCLKAAQRSLKELLNWAQPGKN